MKPDTASLNADLRAAMTKKLEKPDFAFPKSVAKDAEKIFDEALQQHHPVAALRAAMQWNVAEILISNDSVTEVLDRYRLLSRELEQPYSALATLLEMRLLSDVYDSDRYTFDRRTLPADEISPDPLLWSGEQFKNTLRQLARQVLENGESLADMPIAGIAPLLTDSREASACGMTAFDFACYQLIRILDRIQPQTEAPVTALPAIPFTRPEASPADASPSSADASPSSADVSPSSAEADKSEAQAGEADLSYRAEAEAEVDPLYTRSIIDRLIADDSRRGPAASGALLQARLTRLEILTPDSAQSYANELLRLYPPTDPLRPQLVLALCQRDRIPADTPEQIKSKFILIEKTVSDFPDSRYTPALNNILDSMRRPYFNISCQGQMLSRIGGKADCNISNIPDCYILLVRIPDPTERERNGRGLRQRDIPHRSEASVIAHLTHEFRYPGSVNDTVAIPPMKPGYYAILPSATPSLKGLYTELNEHQAAVINVSDLSLFTVHNDRENKTRVYVTDSYTGTPVAGATVELLDRVNAYPKKWTKRTTLRTNSEGWVETRLESFYCDVRHDGSSAHTSIYRYGNSLNYDPDNNYTADVLTDLAIYHPGDRIQCVSVVAKNEDNRLSPAAGKRISMVLRDANYKYILKESFTTDSSGRAVGEFAIPNNSITGTFTIETRIHPDSDSDNGPTIGTAYVEVAEYKAPTFRVHLDDTAVKDDTVEISGNVTTYSGMPLDGEKVTLNINFNRMWWRYGDPNLPSNFSAEVSTGADGRFSLPLGVEKLFGTPYEYGYFTIKGMSTSPSGETQYSDSKEFAISRGYSLELNDLTLEAVSDSITIPVKVTDILGKPVRKELSYKVTSPGGETVAEGKVTSPLLRLPASILPSAKYRVEAVLPEARQEINGPDKGKWVADTAVSSLVVWRAADSRPPYPTPLWIPKSRLYADEAATVDVTAGNSYAGSQLFYQIVDCDSIVKQGWIKASDANVVISAAAPQRGNEVRVTFRGDHNLNPKIASVSILAADRKRKLNFITETFRDRISPLSTEHWRFRLMGDSVPVADGGVMAVLSDAALNAITPFRWSMNPERILNYRIMGGIRDVRIPSTSFGGFTDSFRHISADPVIATPDWNLWGYGLYSAYVSDNIVYFASAGAANSMKRSVASMKYEATDDAITECAMDKAVLAEEEVMTETTDEDDAGVELPATEKPATEKMEFRETSHPLAFFRPLLSTDSEGMLDIEFEVPNFNTTWQLQLLGYDRMMKSAYLELEAIAAKPVMITANMPRFLLTGDHTVVEATFFNNTEETISADALIEIFDPATGRVLATGKADGVSLLPSANAQVMAKVDVPTECNSLGIRASVRSDKGTDGEQDLIQVLPSSQPAMESTTFYLTPETRTLDVQLPKMGNRDMVTLNYCSNPAWYVLTSLSGLIKPDSQSTLCNLNALYANSVASGLLNRYPSLAKGLTGLFESEKSDSLLISPLQKNENLKIADLQDTPWVNNAESETARMQNLRSLTDQEASGKAILSLIETLKKNQKSDGSLAWMPQMDGSLWITLNLIDCAARLTESGYMPESADLSSMVKSALKFTDRNVAKDYLEAVKDKRPYPLTSEMSYLLDRSLLTSSGLSRDLESMRRDMLRRIPEEWRGLGISDKAMAARIMQREGNHQLASQILQSVREFASYKPDKGMWFDKLADSWFAQPPMLVTADCIMAFNEVLPGDDAITKMCQYLVLSRQTEDWNVDMSPGAVTAVSNAVLGSDLGWTDSSMAEPPVITLDGKPLQLPSDAESLTGNFYLNLTPEQASGKRLTITRSASTPAWGGVLRQYVAPASKVKAESVPQLKITKQLLPIESTPSGEKALKSSTRFSKGDLIRVTLTIRTDRELDYLMVTDRRGAFMQPADQLTEYDVIDGVWLLRETRNTATNFFITRLPKGTYVISYDVNADRDGEYSTGIATAQSQYYPLITSHSAGCMVSVE